ncbi:twin-arginine translocation signal domain-containing protein [Halorussus sp. MSC15.2]|uniref:twin-arginine translocation signal domain-containing protein n=1 Tax=Halorussus sp. MSC15.2 TaxID=2283638 RepID=UPI0013D54308|nr:twin-arginine translocation signal domain-containing protein [Halorussus sp. MSC15.2]NEU55400.1 twin-arginine translocation signal domain-containing protein [Halorussus sp. MSC15.2]
MEKFPAQNGALAEHSNRRGFLQNVATGVSAMGVAGLAGCVESSDSATVTDSVSETIDSDSTPLSPDEFDEYVTEMHDRYGDSGPWGKRGIEPDHGLTYVGAWTVHPENSSTSTDGLSSDHLVALYRIPPGKSRGTFDYYQFWIWSAVEPIDRATLKRVRPKVKLLGDERRMRMYSPAAEVTNGPIPVGLSQPTVDGLNVTIPLTSGSIRVNPEETHVGGAGAFTPVWSGSTGSVQSVTATFESSWPSSLGRKFDWTVETTAEADGS